jgi:uncharacterized alkaline shock family protein YloU
MVSGTGARRARLTVRLSNEVLAQIAAAAAGAVPGVAGLSGGLVDDLTGVLAKDNPLRGVHLQVDGKEVAYDLYLAVELGTRIPVVAAQVQEAVQRAVETMTGLTVTSVNIHVQEVRSVAAASDMSNVPGAGEVE